MVEMCGMARQSVCKSGRMTAPKTWKSAPRRRTPTVTRPVTAAITRPMAQQPRFPELRVFLRTERRIDVWQCYVKRRTLCSL